MPDTCECVSSDAVQGDASPPGREVHVSNGDVWQLGDHRLLCGDCTNAEQVGELMQGESAMMVFTDPPYGIGYTGKRKRRAAIHNDGVDPDKSRRLVSEAMRIAPLRPGGAFYVCSAAGTSETAFRLGIADAGLELRQCLVWKKNHFVISRSDYHWKHESILYGWEDGAKHYFIGDRTQHSIWEYPKPHRSPLHPTMKPVALIERAILNSSMSDDIVYDGFGGSGSTLIACEVTGRRCRMVEIDTGYCEVIIRRWRDLTGCQAIRLYSPTPTKN